jgi:hypothetical protein
VILSSKALRPTKGSNSAKGEYLISAIVVNLSTSDHKICVYSCQVVFQNIFATAPD